MTNGHFKRSNAGCVIGIAATRRALTAERHVDRRNSQIIIAQAHVLGEDPSSQTSQKRA
jgi:hypothetical protein